MYSQMGFGDSMSTTLTMTVTCYGTSRLSQKTGLLGQGTMTLLLTTCLSPDPGKKVPNSGSSPFGRHLVFEIRVILFVVGGSASPSPPETGVLCPPLPDHSLLRRGEEGFALPPPPRRRPSA